MDSATAPEILELIAANLALAVTGCHTAVNHYLGHSRAGAIVNVSSHQAQGAVRGALPYATAKAAVEGLTRATAVDHGPRGIRTTRSPSARSAPHATRPTAPSTRRSTSRWPPHPLGRVGTSVEVADTVHFLLSLSAGFINGVVLPVDGGRAANGADPEAT